MQPLQFGVLGGAVLAAIGTFLSWIKVSGFASESANGWNSDLADDLAIGKIIKAGIPVDAIIIVALAALAVYLIVGPMMGMQVPAIPFAGVIVGGLIAAVGIWNYIHIKDEIGDIDGVSIDLGLYLVIAGGAVAAVCTFLEQQQRARA